MSLLDAMLLDSHRMNIFLGYVDATFDAANEGDGIAIHGARNLRIEGNQVDVAQEPIQDLRCGSVRHFDNRGPAGALLAREDPDTGREIEEVDAAAEDALVAALYEKHG